MTRATTRARSARGYLISTVLATALIGPIGFVLGEEDDHSVETGWWHLDNGTGRLTQLNYDEILAEVTSSNKTAYTTASVNTGGSSPFTFKIEAECGAGTPGNLIPPVTHLESGGSLRDVKFYGPNWLGWSVNQNGYSSKNVELNIFNQAAIDAEGFTNIGSVTQGQTFAQAMVANVKEKAIALCNAKFAAAKQSHPNFSDASAFIYVGGIYDLQWNAHLNHSCNYNTIDLMEDGKGGWNGEWHIIERNTDTPNLSVVGKVQCISPFDAPQSASNDIVQAFGVKSAYLEADPNFYRGACPVDVAFNASVSTQGIGELQVEVVNQKGEVRLTKTIMVTQVGGQNFTFVDTFDYPPLTGGGGLVTPPPPGPGLGLTIPPPVGDPAQLGFAAPGGGGGGGNPAGPGNLAGNPIPANIHVGWYKLRVLKPTDSGVESNIAHYSIGCERPEPGPTLVALPPPMCIGGMVQGGQCVCDNGAPAIAGRCGPGSVTGGPVIACQGGTILGNACICPQGQSLDSGRCVPQVVIDCAPGFVLQGTPPRCVPVNCPPNTHFDAARSTCVANLPVGTPTIPPIQQVPPSAFTPIPIPPPVPPPGGQRVIPPTIVTPTPTGPPGTGPAGVTQPQILTPQIVCAGGTVKAGQCSCPSGQIATATGANSFRCATQQVVITCTGGTIKNGQCSCPSNWTRQTVTIAPTAQIYNCRPPSSAAR